MIVIITIVLVMGMMGLLFGTVLALANRRLAVQMNPLIHKVEDVLPKGQCGACGYPGCQAYAKAVVMEDSIAPNLCIPGKAEVAKKVAELTGKKTNIVESKVATICCSNPISTAKKLYNYYGIKDCVAASILHLGPKYCKYGCIGLGTCASQCPFGAIKIKENGLPQVDSKKCTGCGKCEVSCPKQVIKLNLSDSKVLVTCSSQDKGAVAKKSCEVACIGCGLCKNSCPYNAIKIENNLAAIDAHICIEKCTDPVCVDKCPLKVINLKRTPA